MKILWLSMNKGLYNSTKNSGYNGCGWISSLQKLFLNKKGIELGLSFISDQNFNPISKDNFYYFPITEKSKSSFHKIIEYYGGYKKNQNDLYIQSLLEIVNDFKPDIIHLFGLENPQAIVLDKVQVPIVVHLQGLLGPYDNAFFPVDFNKSTFWYPFSIREWILRNGYIYAKKSIHIRGKRESALFKLAKYYMGRTEWDYNVSNLLSPNSQYYLVNEVLRNIFYDNAGTWQFKDKELTIISTISNTIYKGLDLILKTSKLLKTEANISFKWNVVGINKCDRIVTFFEHKLGICSTDVNINYLGVLDENQLCKELLDSHIYVHPSYIDNSPNSLCESQLLGMPVIGTYVGGIPSLIEDKTTGILVPANAPYEVAYHIKEFYNDKNMMITLGNNAFKAASLRHNREKIYEELIDTYREVIQDNAMSGKLKV